MAVIGRGEQGSFLGTGTWNLFMIFFCYFSFVSLFFFYLIFSLTKIGCSNSKFNAILVNFLLRTEG